MKRNFLLSMGAFLAILAVGCTADVEVIVPQPSAPDGAIAININGAITQEYTTRVDDGGFCGGDQVGLFGVNYTNDNTTQGTLLDKGNQVDNARYTYDEANGQWVSNGSIYYKDAETNIDIYAYYPYMSIDSTDAHPFEVALDQSGATTVDGYAQSDFLWAIAENVTPSESKVKLQFSHRLAGANVVLTEGSGFAEGEFATLKKQVLVMNTTRTATIDLATGVATATGEAELEGIVMKQNSEGFRAIVVPQSVEAGKALLSIAVDGMSYRFKHNETFNYEAGKMSKLSIKINKKAHSGEYEFVLTDVTIKDWVADLESHGGEARQYYVVHLDEGDTLEEKIKADGKNPAKIKNLKVSGKIYADDFYFMRDKMDILQAVNLKECEVVGDPYQWYWWGYIDGEWKDVYFETDYPNSWEDATREVEERFPGSTFEHHGYNRNDNYGKGANEIPDGAFKDKSTLVYFVFPEIVTKIGYDSFSRSNLSGALIIPNDVEEIGGYAFYNTNISSLQLSTSLKSIGGSAFQECASLGGNLSLPETLEDIGGWCFYGCNMLSGTLTIPSKIKNISSYCFAHCNFTGDLIIPDGVTRIEDGAFGSRNTGVSSHNCFRQLYLPNSLKSIGGDAFIYCSIQGDLVIPASVQVLYSYCFSNNKFSSVVFAENSELIKIENNVFTENWRLSEPIVLPDDITTIGNNAFAGCSSLPSISIPKNVTTIGVGAFQNCFYLTSMQCDATIPPVVGSGAFDGVAKDNFTLQVPEDAVARYQTANGWSEFKRISANYDFSISRKHIRALNAEYSKSYLLRAPSGESWSVESCPDWVTVTPSSGVGREEVTVTISEMTRTDDTFTREEWNNGYYKTEEHKGRSGEIIFKLDYKKSTNGDNVTVKMAVEQYDYDYADGDVIVNQTASVGAGVNIVFMGDCFDARDIAKGSYLDGVNEAIDYYFGIEPYKSYKEYFNVYTVVGMSNDSGMGTVNTIRDAKFGSQYSLSGITPDTQTTYEYAMLAETVDESNLNKTLVVMVENTTDYGGICYMWGDGSAIAVCPMSRDAYPFDYRGIVQHEAGGHGFAKLADEYIYTNGFIESCGCGNPHLSEFYAGKSLGWYRNLSTNGDYKTVEWAHLFANPDYSNIVDMYEGGYFHTRGIYRSEANSCMNNNIPYYSAISRQEMVERIMRYGGLDFDINDFYARDVRDASNNTSAMTMAVESSIVVNSGAGKQMPPKYMGDKPQLKKSNK